MKEPTIVRLGREYTEGKRTYDVHFTKDPAADVILNDIVNTPHAFVLACLMDKQMPAETAWIIPIEVFNFFGSKDIHRLGEIPESDYIKLFVEKKLHRFKEEQAKVFYAGVRKIVEEYNGDAANIWKGNPSSSTVVFRFMQFKGAGVKIATMAANILARQMHVKYSDYYSIDISPDVHIMRIFRRMGYVSKDATRDDVIYWARSLNPEYPGIVDAPCWEIGRSICRPTDPQCSKCPLYQECEYAHKQS